MFKVNDKVVYPGHGVAIIEEVVEKIVAGTTTIFFKLTFPYRDMTVLVPKQRLESTGIRSLSSKDEINVSLAELHELPKCGSNGELIPTGWSRRHREYQLKIQRGRLIDVASIYRDLMYAAQRKELSFGEKNLMQATEDLLVQEIFTARKCEQKEILSQVRSPFAKNCEKENEKTIQQVSGL